MGLHLVVWRFVRPLPGLRPLRFCAQLRQSICASLLTTIVCLFTIDNSCPLRQRGHLEMVFCHGESSRDEIFSFWVMGMLIYELWTVMETIKTVSVVSKRDLGLEVECCENYNNGFCGLAKRLRHGRERHVLHPATGTSSMSLVFPHCSIGSHWTTRRIEVAVVA